MKRAGGQSIVEYATLFAAVSIAVTIMVTYAQRALNANVANLERELSPMPLTADGSGAGPVPGTGEDELAIVQEARPLPKPFLRAPYAFVDGE